MELIHPKCQIFWIFQRLRGLRDMRDMNWLQTEFPKLKHIEFNNIELSNEVFIEFQNRNIQLESLSLSYMDSSPIVFELIETRLPNLVNVFLLKVGNLDESISHLKELPRLKRLYLCHVADLDKIKSLLSSLQEKNQPIVENITR